MQAPYFPDWRGVFTALNTLRDFVHLPEYIF